MPKKDSAECECGSQTMDGEALDRCIRDDEERLLGKNSLAALPEEDRQKIYAECVARPKTSPQHRPVMVMGGAHPKGPLTYLSLKNPVDLLPSHADESVLAEEYTQVKDLYTADRIVREDGCAPGAGGAARPATNPKARWAAALCQERDLNEAEHEQLYEQAKAAAQATFANKAGAEKRGPRLDSELPGPYLTFESNGRYTNYEAIVHRAPIRGSAADIIGSNMKGRTTERSKHYPTPRQGAEPAEAAEHGREGRPATTGSRQRSSLFRWQYSMGLVTGEHD